MTDYRKYLPDDAVVWPALSGKRYYTEVQVLSAIQRAVEDEREDCAKICDRCGYVALSDLIRRGIHLPLNDSGLTAQKEIRARSNKTESERMAESGYTDQRR